MFATTLLATLSLLRAAPATPVAPPSQAKPSFRVLLVGLGPYNDSKTGFGELSGAEDVKRMQAALKRYWGLTDANFHLVLGKEANKQKILDEFRNWLVKDAKPGDTIFFMYSGHGTLVPDPTKNLGVTSAIVPIDIRRAGDRTSDIVKESVISSTEIRAELLNLKKAGVRNVTLFFDSCHSGGISRGTARAKGGINPAAMRAMVRGRGDQAPAMDSDLDDLPGIVIVGAARSDQQAWEGNEGGNLTVAAIEALHQRAGEQGKSGQGSQISMTYRDWFDRIQARMATLPQSLPQEPQLVAGDNGAREVFGTKLIVPEPSFLVFAEGNSPEEMTLRLRAGEVFGLKDGMTVSIYPRGTTKFDGTGGSPIASAQIQDSDSFVCNLRLLADSVAKFGKKLTELNGCPAVVQDSTPDASVRVQLDARIPSDVRSALLDGSKLFKPASSGNGDVVIVPPGTGNPNDRFPVSPEGYMVYDQTGKALSRPVPAGTPADTAIGLSQPLKDWARRQAVLNLMPSAEPEVKVEMELVPVETKSIPGARKGSDQQVVGVQPKAIKSQRLTKTEYFAIRVRATLPDGKPVAGDPLFRMDFSRFIAVLDILPNGEVKELWPDRSKGVNNDDVRLACDGKWYYLGLNSKLVGEDELAKIVPWFVDPSTGLGQEIFKLMATASYQDFRPLLTRGKSRGSDQTDRLGEIMTAFSNGEPLSRAGNGGNDPKPGKWSVAEITVIVADKKDDPKATGGGNVPND